MLNKFVFAAVGILMSLSAQAQQLERDAVVTAETIKGLIATSPLVCHRSVYSRQLGRTEEDNVQISTPQIFFALESSNASVKVTSQGAYNKVEVFSLERTEGSFEAQRHDEFLISKDKSEIIQAKASQKTVSQLNNAAGEAVQTHNTVATDCN